MRTLLTIAMCFAITTAANADLMNFISGDLVSNLRGSTIFKPETGEVVGAWFGRLGDSFNTGARFWTDDTGHPPYHTCNVSDVTGWINQDAGTYELEVLLWSDEMNCAFADRDNPHPFYGPRRYLITQDTYENSSVTFAVPEPSSITLMALAGLFLLRFRRRA
ncbi:MAG: PEP-CTERM sorting domain-containing protein [Pirellulaceae bacterium]|nr:PEP-CTERM sorting domain-containing protein [Pirellulaceae bacterium]